MANSEVIKIVHFSGQALSSDQAAIGKLAILAVNVRDPKQQYRAKTGATGQFVMALPAGCYDLLLKVKYAQNI